MQQTAQMTKPIAIPPTTEIRARLSEIAREAMTLRSLLKIAKRRDMAEGTAPSPVGRQQFA